MLPLHPAHKDSATSAVCKFWQGAQEVRPKSYQARVVKEMYRITNDDSALLHVVLGKDVIDAVSTSAEAMLADLDKSLHYSEDLDDQ